MNAQVCNDSEDFERLASAIEAESTALMFQTEPILALQSLEWLRLPMWLVSQLGSMHILIGIMLVVVYMIDFRKGFVLVQVVAWNGLLTGFLKGSFALPRPDAVDSRVLLGGTELNPVAFEARGASGFFEALPRDILAFYRSSSELSYGLPSGHCSSTTTTWGSIALLFREPAVRGVALVMILLMPVSRMYLGRHFLGGVFAGVGLGLLAVTTAWFAVMKGFEDSPSLWDRLKARGGHWPTGLSYAYFFALPLAATALPHVDLDDCARLLGINLGWVLLLRRGLPRDGGSAWRRMARFLLAVGCFVVVDFTIGKSGEALTPSPWDWPHLLTGFTATLTTLWGATELALKLKLFEGRRDAEPVVTKTIHRPRRNTLDSC